MNATTARRSVDVDGDLWRISVDERRRRADIVQSILLAFVTDDVTGRPIASTVRVATSLARASGASAGSGVCGLVGQPAAVFPSLSSQSYTVDAVLRADGFAAAELSMPIGPQPNFPGEFDPLVAGPIALRREPVLLTVRAVTLDSQLVTHPVAGATVEVTGIWRHTEDLVSAAAPADLLVLDQPASAARPLGATVTPAAVTPIAEPARALLADGAVAADTVVVDRRGALAAGDIVAIDRHDADRAEHIEVQDVAGGVDPQSPATVTLRFPLQRDHRRGASVERVMVAPTGVTAVSTTDDCARRDTTLFVDSTSPFGSPTAALITGGGAPPEVRIVRPYSVVTGADGFGRLPPLGRIAAIRLSGSAGALTAGPETFTPDYGTTANTTHLVLS